MSNLKCFEDEERESKYGRVYAVSGPGKFENLFFSILNSY